MSRKLSLHIEKWPLKSPFRITGMVWTELDVVVVEIGEGDVVGRGEAAGVYYLGENANSIYEQIVKLTDEVEAGADRKALLQLLPAGGARNAIDCALWDLESQLSQTSVRELAGIETRPLTTVYTIGIRDTPEQMAEIASKMSAFPALKIKLDEQQPIERLAAVREARPDATIIVDANQGFNIELLHEVLPEFDKLQVAMVEQPLKRGEDEALEGLTPRIPLCADESCLDRSELAIAAKRYQMINIKLDKTGGLTEALALAREAQALGLDLMVGNMFGTSLAMTPGFLIGQLCRFVDLDGPLWLTHDRPRGLAYESGTISLPEQPLWGSGGLRLQHR